MDKLPEWWSSKEFEALDAEHDSELLRERVLRLENLYNTLVTWINEHEKHKHVGYVIDEHETKGHPGPK